MLTESYTLHLVDGTICLERVLTKDHEDLESEIQRLKCADNEYENFMRASIDDFMKVYKPYLAACEAIPKYETMSVDTYMQYFPEQQIQPHVQNPGAGMDSLNYRWDNMKKPGLHKIDYTEVVKDNIDFYMMKGNYAHEWDEATAHLKGGAKQQEEKK